MKPENKFSKKLTLDKLEIFENANNYLANAEKSAAEKIAAAELYCQELEKKLREELQLQYANEVFSLNQEVKERVVKLLESINTGMVAVLSSVANKMGYHDFNENFASELVHEELTNLRGQDNIIIRCHPESQRLFDKLDSQLTAKIRVLPSTMIPQGKLIVESDKSVKEISFNEALDDINEILKEKGV